MIFQCACSNTRGWTLDWVSAWTLHVSSFFKASDYAKEHDWTQIPCRNTVSTCPNNKKTSMERHGSQPRHIVEDKHKQYGFSGLDSFVQKTHIAFVYLSLVVFACQISSRKPITFKISCFPFDVQFWIIETGYRWLFNVSHVWWKYGKVMVVNNSHQLLNMFFFFFSQKINHIISKCQF